MLARFRLLVTSRHCTLHISRFVTLISGLLKHNKHFYFIIPINNHFHYLIIMENQFKFVVLIAIFVQLCESARILAVFPTPILTHQLAFRPFVRELLKHGHEVVVVTTDPAFPKEGAPKNLTEVDIHDISYSSWMEKSKNELKKFNQDLGSILLGTKNFKDSIKLVYLTSIKVFEAQMKSEQIQNLIKTGGKFDLIFLEAWVRPILVFSHIFKAPVIQISSCGFTLGNYEAIAGPVHPLYHPHLFRLRIYNLSIIEKLTELYNYVVFAQFYNDHQTNEDGVIRKLFGSNTPSLSELSKNINMMFLNENYWDITWPIPSSVQLIGGAHIESLEHKPLSHDLQQYLDSSRNGVIYVSFGTNVNPSLFMDKIQIMLDVFSKLPYDILLKWDSDELPGQPKNVRVAKWFPQFDILRHSKVKLFITQCGRHSTDEAIIAGVPLLGMPLLADQWYNAEKYVHSKIGLKLNWEQITEETLTKSIKLVIEDQSYRLNVLRLQRVMQDQPLKPLQRAIWWTEHVLRHGADHLRTPTANMSWIEYLELKLFATLLLIILIILFIIISVLYILVAYLKAIFLSKTKEKHN